MILLSSVFLYQSHLAAAQKDYSTLKTDSERVRQEKATLSAQVSELEARIGELKKELAVAARADKLNRGLTEEVAQLSGKVRSLDRELDRTRTS